MKHLLLFVIVLLAGAACHAQRITISLDGTWDIADSVSATVLPTRYDHKAPVPGLAHSSTPAFAHVDEFDSRELIVNRVGRKEYARSALVQNAGVPHQERNYFWYRTAFRTPEKRATAILRINKAQFGAAVWLNGVKIGEHLPCFSAAVFDVTGAIDWNKPNELVVRVGAHPGVLPDSVSAGTDFEKNRWTPGIYDRVSVLLANNPVIETVQAAPRIATGEVVVQTRLRNQGPAPAPYRLAQTIEPWKQETVVARSAAVSGTLAAGEERTITQTVRIPNARLWSPEDPFLYKVGTSTGGDSATTRFGMREFRFDTATGRAYLNGKVYFLRGSNITLHRFFEDPQSGALPWNEQWLRKLLVGIPKRMHWNSFRFCIGPVPDHWLEIADEAGLLIQNEYFVWTGHNWHGKDYVKKFDVPEMITEFSEWMRDNWNHPSVAIWDANNETWDPDFGTKIIPAVRALDLSNRPWENSYNAPAGPDDPVEDHPYEHSAIEWGGKFDMTDLERRNGAERGGDTVPGGHASIINEYGWLWLNRDGSPTLLTRKVYEKLLGPNATAEQRFEMNAYLLGGLTEFWRAHRQRAGVLHFVYLTAGRPDGFTCDHFRDVEKLKLDPYFEDYLSNAFQPLGVYIDFWQPRLDAGSTRTIKVMMVNDDARPVTGKLSLTFVNESGETLSGQALPFEVAGLGQRTYFVDVNVPAYRGKAVLKATAEPDGTRHDGPTISRRKLALVEASAESPGQ